MKKIIIAIAMFAGISSVNAQSFNEGTSVLQAGIGFGGAFGTPITLGYEYGVTEKIGVGLSVGYGSKTQSFFGGDYKYTNILVGLKGNYHFYTTDVVDVYGGAILGYNNQSVTTTFTGPGAQVAASKVLLGAQLGGRYYFTESLGAFAELGFGLANFNVGLAYKL